MATVGKDSKHLIQFWNSGKYTTVCRDNLSINIMIVRLLQELEEFYNLGRKTIIFTHMITFNYIGIHLIQFWKSEIE